MSKRRYELVANARGETGIRCNTCGKTSWHPEDVQRRYCGYCHVWHELEALREELEDERRGMLA